MKKLNKKGFTLIELMIATSIFSVVLLVCLGAIIYVGRLYYKGITVASTLDTTRETIELVAESVQFSGENVITLPSRDGWEGGYCISGVKYSFKRNTQLRKDSPGDGQSDEVLLVSQDPGCSIDSSPQPIGTERRELLREDMRLTVFRVAPTASGLTELEVGVAFGGDPNDSSVEQDTFRFDSGGAIIGCNASGRATAFCAVSYLGTSVIRRVQ